MTTPSQSHSQPLPTILLLVLAVATYMILEAAAAEQDYRQLITLHGCPDKCGDTSIPYPFGMKPGCFREGFQITCNDSFNPHRAYLANSEVYQWIKDIYHRTGLSCHRHRVWHDTLDTMAFELIDVSVADGEARAYAAVSSCCSVNRNYSLTKSLRIQLGNKTSPFLLSAKRNVLIGIGWRVQPKMHGHLLSESASEPVSNEVTISCLSYLMRRLKFLKLETNGSCTGRGCCEVALPEEVALNQLAVWFSFDEPNTLYETNPCSYAMVVEKSRYNFSTPDMYGYEELPKRFPRGVPFVIDFSIRNGTCPAEGQHPPLDYACLSRNSYCANATSGQGYVCKCWDHYHGNPYIPNVCQGGI